MRITFDKFRSRWNRYADSIADSERYPAFSFIAQTALLLGLFLLLNRYFPKRSVVEEEDYFAPVLVLRLLFQSKSAFFGIVVSLPLALGWKKLSWEMIAGGRTLRIFIVMAVALLAWAFAAYDYNFFLGRGHYFDRALLIGLAAFCIWRPGFVPLFLMQAFLLAEQFYYPLHRFSWTDKLVLYEILVLWSAYLWLLLALPRTEPRAFALIAFCLLASQYFYSGVAKLELDWLRLNDLSNLFVSAYDNGLWGYLSEDQLQLASGFISGISLPLMLLTFFLEIGVIVALCNRWVLAIFCAGLALMHLGILLSSGIFFWKWIVLDIGFIYLWFKLGLRLDAALPTRYLPFLLSLVLIPASEVMWEPKHLGWYDTPLSGVFRMDAIDSAGRVQEVTPSDLAPYDFVFAQGRFHYLNEEPNIVGTSGNTADPSRLKALEACKTPEDVLAYKKTIEPKRKKDKKSVARYEKFLHQFFQGMNDREGHRTFFSRLAPPHHIWTYPTRGEAFHWTEPIRKIRVRYAETFFDGERRHLVSDVLLKELDIPSTNKGSSTEASASP